jgi:hypothetical protein
MAKLRIENLARANLKYYPVIYCPHRIREPLLKGKAKYNRRAHIRHQCRKTLVLSCDRCLITLAFKNELNLIIDYKFEHQMSLSKSKCCYEIIVYIFKVCCSIELAVVTSLNQFILILNELYAFHKTSYHNEEVNCTEPYPSVCCCTLNSSTL